MQPISRFERLFLRLAPMLILVASVLVVVAVAQIGKTKYAVKETSAYTRVSNCIVSKVANRPTSQDDVERCYIQVEKDSGLSLERFDKQTHNENLGN